VSDQQTRIDKLLATVTSRIVLLMLMAVGGIVTARALQPAGRGTYAVIVAIASTSLALGHLSIEQSNVYLWYRGVKPRVLAANSIVIGAATGIGSAIAAYALVSFVPNAFPGIDRRVLAIALLSVPFTMIALYLFGLVTLDDRIGRANVVRVTTAALQIACFALLALTGRLSPGSVVAVWAITSSLPAFALVSGFGARRSFVRPALALEAVGIGARYHAGLTSLFLLWRIDMFLLNAQASRREVGLYALAVSIAELGYLVTDSVAQVALPRQVVGSFDEAAAFTARILRLNTAAGLFAILLIGVSSPLLVPVAFGESFSGSVVPLLALLPGVAALGLIRPATSLMLRLNRPAIVTFLTLSALSVNVGVNLTLIPHFGAVGASLASTVAYAGLAVAYVVWFLRAANVSFSDLIPRMSELRSVLRTLPIRRRRLEYVRPRQSE
jgi:O-antigen/teichoic acid export membrane protein